MIERMKQMAGNERSFIMLPMLVVLLLLSLIGTLICKFV